MSSTNRSAAREAHVSDYYVTPIGTIMDFLKAFKQDSSQFSMRFNDEDKPLRVLDPCAGGDAKHEMSYPTAILNHSDWIVGNFKTIDIREDSRATIKADFLKLEPDGISDVVITNPPFNVAQSIIDHSLQFVRPGGLVIMLCRLNFLGSQERAPWWKKNMPVLTYVHSKRIKFKDTAGTDSVEYAHLVWQRGNPCYQTQLRII